jgi:hypothetical protein
MTDQDKYECAKRELAMRRRVYPKWVDSGRMSQDKADHEIAVMAAIVEDYKAKITPSLFAQQEST